MPKVQQVIVSTVLRGYGHEKSHIRSVTQVHDFDGNLIAENDPCVEPPKDLPEGAEG